jgi:hypothetical protein
LGVGEFLEQTVLPALQERLDLAFPEFGWKRDVLGWVATNEETTHSVLGVRADRVVAHGPGPPGFLIHGGDAIPWTAYVNGGQLPRGREFVQAVRELATRAGVDTAPIDQSQPRDRRTDLLHDFFTLCRIELRGERGERARRYLEVRGLPADAIDGCGLGVVPAERDVNRLLEAGGYTDLEIARSGVLADKRWSGRLCGAWRDDHANIRTLWARTLHDADTAPKFLYLRGARRSDLPPYGLSDVLKLPPRERRELVLVEGLLDVHHLRAHGLANVAAVGGARIRLDMLSRLTSHGFETVTLALDNDQPGRDALVQVIDRSARLEKAPEVRVVDPDELGDSKDPDEYVRKHGVDAFRMLIGHSECGITWRTFDRLRHLETDSSPRERRAALADVGKWLGTLPARLALEVEDAIWAAGERTGYDPIAVERAFQARYWPSARPRPWDAPMRREPEIDRSVEL